MTANELRTGNLIWLFDEVITVSWHEIRFITDHSENKFEGIPLDEEWLLRFGFEKYQTGRYINDLVGAELINGKFMFRWNDEPVRFLQYVHEAQNFFYCLTGEELTINKTAPSKT